MEAAWQSPWSEMKLPFKLAQQDSVVAGSSEQLQALTAVAPRKPRKAIMAKRMLKVKMVECWVVECWRCCWGLFVWWLMERWFCWEEREAAYMYIHPNAEWRLHPRFPGCDFTVTLPTRMYHLFVSQCTPIPNGTLDTRPMSFVLHDLHFTNAPFSLHLPVLDVEKVNTNHTLSVGFL